VSPVAAPCHPVAVLLGPVASFSHWMDPLGPLGSARGQQRSSKELRKTITPPQIVGFTSGKEP